jgi:suppressor for copper-sensitivity B
MRRSVSFVPAVLIVAVALVCRVAQSAGPPPAGPPPGGKIRLDSILGPPKATSVTGNVPESPSADDQLPTVRVALVPTAAKTGDVVTLAVTVTVPGDSYTYSTNPSGLGATRIEIADAAGLTPLGDFEADHAPKIVKDESTEKPVEKFEHGVTWLRQYKMTAERPEEVHVNGLLDLRYCSSKGCRIFSQKFDARLVKTVTAGIEAASVPESTLSQVVIPKSFGGQSGHAKLNFLLSPADPKPGDTVTLDVTMSLDPDWHTYSTTQKEGSGSTTTKIDLKSTKNLQPIGENFKPSREPEQSAKEAAGLEAKEIYHGEVTWTRKFKFQPAANDSSFGVSGSVHYGICNQAMCLPPQTVNFRLGDLKGAGKPPAPLADKSEPMSDGSYVAESGSLAFYLFGAFFGGMLLNVMPCVLPVLAIKVLSFVQQAGESRSRIFLLNVAYSIGVLAVFFVLATLAVGTRLGLSSADLSWGGLFADTRFNMVMACLVFAMGLSLLGVFEIPVPGMVGSAAGGNRKEGLLGALLTGIFATLLATPCTGPIMAAAVGWSVRQPTHIVYLVWGVMGLGMAFPYLLLGMFPRLVRWLPKPGTWMIRLKEFAGFVLLASVIFIIYYTDKRFTIPVLVMLLGVALGLWMIGNLYDINSHIRHKTTVRAVALFLTAIICWIGFSLSVESKYKLHWEPFSESRLTALFKEKKTVLIDFTAEWCINCHVNERVALNTAGTQSFVEQHDIVPLLADFTDQSPELKRWLHKFQQDGVPLTVIFPADRQNEPIVLSGLYSQGTLLEKLHEALGAGNSARSDELATSVR